MADEFGPTKPAGPDPIDERLRQLARETEPLVILSGPAAARRRGERRRNRRRAGAVCLAAALALGVGSWQLLPRLGTGGSGTQPAATASFPGPTSVERLSARLQQELLPPSALPLYPKREWQVVPEKVAAAKFPESCPVTRLPSSSLARAEQVYGTSDGFVAHYYLFALPSEQAATAEAAEMEELIKGKCGWAEGIDGDSVPDRSVFPAGAAFRGQVRTLWLDRQGTFVALLEVGTSAAGHEGKSGFSDSGPLPALCIARSLGRLVSAGPSGGPSVDPSAPSGVGSPASPSTPEAPPQGSGTGYGTAAGSGSGTGGDPSAALPPGSVHSATPSC
jgi:hypothetical protein